MRIQISQLTFEYPNRAFRLRIPELCVESGTVAAFVGPSGSGKSTLLRLLAGIYVPNTGTLTCGSIRLPQLSDAGRREFRIGAVGFVFQDFQLIEYLNVEENIRLPFRIHPAMQWNVETAIQLKKLA